MAFYRAAIGGGGGQTTETTLWTNPDTTANMGSTTVTLSDDMTNYDLLKFEFKALTTSSDSDKISTYISPADFISCGTNATKGKLKFALDSRTESGTNGVMFSRAVCWVSNTSINIAGTNRLGNSGNENNRIIPIKIIGVKGGYSPDIRLSGAASPCRQTVPYTITKAGKYLAVYSSQTTHTARLETSSSGCTLDLVNTVYNSADTFVSKAYIVTTTAANQVIYGTANTNYSSIQVFEI